MSELAPTGSPFDQIRREDEHGEFWTGRELMPLLGYDQWRRFEDAIKRAQQSAQNVGADPSQHFALINDVAGGGNINDHGYRVKDYRLTRYAAYLIGMNGDPRKPEIARAQTYFAIKTRETELRGGVEPAASVVPQFEIPQTHAEALRMAAEQMERAEAAEALAAEQHRELAATRPRAAYVDAWVDPAADATTVGVFAKQLQVREKELRLYLQNRRVMYRRVVGKRWSTSAGKEVTEYQWLPHSGYEAWFVLKDQPDAPRDHNDQLRTTLYVSPVGKVRIKELLERRPIDSPKGGAA